MRSDTRTLTGLAMVGTVAVLMAGTARADGLYSLRAAEVARNPATGLVRAMSSPANGPLAYAGPGAAALSFEGAAVSFLAGQGKAFGIRSVAELRPVRTAPDEIGRTFVRVQQTYAGLPILGAELNVQMDAAKNVMSVGGKTVGDLAVDTTPAVSAADAARTALDATARRHHLAVADLTASVPQLAIHDPRVIGGPAQPPHIVWNVEVDSASRDDIREVVFVDAINGRVSVEFNAQPNAVPANARQIVCDAGRSAAKYPCTRNVAIGAPAKSKLADVRNAFRFAEFTYDFYARRFNRNSLDNKGLVLASTVRYVPNNCGSACPDGKFANAFWDGSQMVYGEDYASGDDVVGHELTHGFTDFSSHLFYFYQSGAINESLSDIFGEFIDQADGVDGKGGKVKWLMGEDLPIGAIRSMQDPTRFGDPDRMTSPNYTGDFGGQDAGGVHTNSGVGNKTAYLIAAPGKKTFNGQTVVGIGVDKSAAIWYRVNNFMLQSGSDYADVGVALNQACRDLIGVRPKNQRGKPSPSGKITKFNCAQVAKAVKATELAKPPLVWPIPAEAPYCAGKARPVYAFQERFEEKSSSKYRLAPSDNHWFVTTAYAASNSHAVGAGNVSGGSLRFSTQLTMKFPVKVPPKAFLRFAQMYNLYNQQAGGVVEYQIAGTKAWHRVQPFMFTHNKYNAQIAQGSGNVLAGQRAFSGFSGGWTSSRINLAKLAGKRVKFRFRLATGNAGAWDAWLIDDVQMFACPKGVLPVASAGDGGGLTAIR